MRLKSAIWVAAYLRRCQTEGIFGAVRRRGAEEAGAVFVKVALLDGNAMLYAPAPQTVYDDSRPTERLFVPGSQQPVPEPSVEERLAKALAVERIQAIWKDKAAEAGGEKPEKFAERIRFEIDKWQKVVEAAGVKLD